MISKDQKENIICTIDECGETFYGRDTAQHPAAVIINNNKKFRSFKSKKTFIRKKLGHTAVSAIQASSVTLLIWQKEPEEKLLICKFKHGSRLKDWYKSKNTKLFKKKFV